MPSNPNTHLSKIQLLYKKINNLKNEATSIIQKVLANNLILLI